MAGWARRNMFYMRAFAEARPNREIVQRLVAFLPWGHNLVLLDKIKSITDRIVYAQLAIKNGWSRNVLVHQVEMKAADRFRRSVTNFKATLPESDSDLAAQTLRDEYNLSFLGADEKIKENRLRALPVDKVAKFLVELGVGFLYVGKALPITVGGEDLEMDLLFYHVALHRYVVIELKTRKFRPQDLGQLSFYMTAVDRQVKSKTDGKTIGLVLCKSRNDIVAEYALSDMKRPMGVSTYQLGPPPLEQLQEKLQRVLAAPPKKGGVK